MGHHGKVEGDHHAFDKCNPDNSCDNHIHDLHNHGAFNPMPITQQTVINLMQESRRAHQYGRQLRDHVITYFSQVIDRYPNNAELQEVVRTMLYLVQNNQPPDDRETWTNEHHYRRHAKRNDGLRKRQEVIRRMAGIPTQEEALAILHAKNELRRADLPTSAEDYKSAPQTNVPRASRPNLIVPTDVDQDDQWQDQPMNLFGGTSNE